MLSSFWRLCLKGSTHKVIVINKIIVQNSPVKLFHFKTWIRKIIFFLSFGHQTEKMREVLLIFHLKDI